METPNWDCVVAATKEARILNGIIERRADELADLFLPVLRQVSKSKLKTLKAALNNFDATKYRWKN